MGKSPTVSVERSANKDKNTVAPDDAWICHEHHKQNIPIAIHRLGARMTVPWRATFVCDRVAVGNQERYEQEYSGNFVVVANPAKSAANT